MKKIAILLFGLLCFGSSKADAFQFWGAGNMSSNKIAFPSSYQVTVATNVSINPSATYVVVASTGGAITFGVGSSYPAISTATATDGQYLVLMATQSVNTVVISTSPLTAVVGPDATITLTSSSKGGIAFIFNALLSQWVEVSKQ